MSLQPQALYCVSEDTARVARAIFPDSGPGSVIAIQLAAL